MKIIQTDKLVIKSWCNNPEQGAIDQAINLAKLPFAFKHIALMPDTHQGYGMPIGGVLACENAIVPEAVGVDIGCGIHATKMNILIKDLTKDQIKSIMGIIRENVPVGFNHHKEPKKDLMEKYELTKNISNLFIVNKEFQKASHQLGTLGNGNHFIELQKDSDGYVWFMLHSGSRNLGKKVADFYSKKALELNKLWYSVVDEKWELSFLPKGHYDDYLNEMNYCLNFAYSNRQVMAEEIKKAFDKILGVKSIQEINIHHNYASLENHYGRNVWIHRKGATSAREGELGIIPGSQGTSSYIVKGKGNLESFTSCSHGAGRRMSRNEARKTLNLEEEIKKMNDKNIVHGIRSVDDLDESAGSYKDIDIVMEEQKDLVDIVVKLEPLGVIKG
jgi:tRNA-splicing ligase RtcB